MIYNDSSTVFKRQIIRINDLYRVCSSFFKINKYKGMSRPILESLSAEVAI